MVAPAKLGGLAVAVAAFGLATACSDLQSPKLAANLLPTGGTLVAATKTTGSDIDPNGYMVWVDDQWSQSPSDNGVAFFNGLSGGDHKVALLRVAANCIVTALPGTGPNNPRTVTIVDSVTGATEFDLGCASVGSLFISTSTSGVDLDADGYTVSVDDSSRQLTATNGDVTFTGLMTGSHSVALSGVAGNCTVNGGNVQTASVTAGGMANLAFSIRCVPIASGTGSLTVVTSTTGFNLDPDTFTVTIDGTVSKAIAINGSTTFSVPAGANPVALSGVASNCIVSGANPRTVTVAAGGASTTTFAVTCGAQPPAEVSGHVQLGWEPARTRNQVQTFDFDVRADLTGRLTVTDYGDIHPSGRPASLTTDPANDPATHFIAYRNPGRISCEQEGRGVEIEGVGRDDEGALRMYTLQVCDDGLAGSGADFLSIYVVDAGYGRSGVLTAGDIAKR
jgi:hypothetical protein